MSLAGALIGYGFMGLATRKLLTDPTLPAPEARACGKLVQSATTDTGSRPDLARSLSLSLVASFLSPLLVLTSLASERIGLLERGTGDRQFQLGLPFAAIYIGIGGLVNLATALLIFSGSFLRLVGDWTLSGIPAVVEIGGNPVVNPLATRYPADSMRWVGGGAMLAAVAYSLLVMLRNRRVAAAANSVDALLELEPRLRRNLAGSIATGAVILIGWIVFADGVSPFAVAMTVAILAMCTLMVPLGAILSLQIGSSASPVSGTVFVTTVVLCLVALYSTTPALELVPLLTALLVGACVAVCTANDASQDYRTLQLCGIPPREAFGAQYWGLLAGCVLVPVSMYVAHEAYGLGTNALVAPQAGLFASVVDTLLLQTGDVPW